MFPNPFIEKLFDLPKDQVADLYLFSGSGELLLKEKVSQINGTIVFLWDHSLGDGMFQLIWQP